MSVRKTNVQYKRAKKKEAKVNLGGRAFVEMYSTVLHYLLHSTIKLQTPTKSVQKSYKIINSKKKIANFNTNKHAFTLWNYTINQDLLANSELENHTFTP